MQNYILISWGYRLILLLEEAILPLSGCSSSFSVSEQLLMQLCHENLEN